MKQYLAALAAIFIPVEEINTKRDAAMFMVLAAVVIGVIAGVRDFFRRS